MNLSLCPHCHQSVDPAATHCNACGKSISPATGSSPDFHKIGFGAMGNVHVEHKPTHFVIEKAYFGATASLGGADASPDLRRGQPRRPGGTPHNLPRLQYFFGRDDDLKKIADALAPEARGWGALIDGPGGIGKTTLAIRAAELVPAGRFHRIIFLSAKERELTADGQRPRNLCAAHLHGDAQCHRPGAGAGGPHEITGS